MHFAYPPRKSSNPPPFAPRSSKQTSSRRRLAPRVLILIGLAVVALLFFWSRPKSSAPYREHVPSGNPPVVIVTAFDGTKQSHTYVESIKENRVQYAARHGYETFFPNAGDYDLMGAPMSWTKVKAVRHALSKFPDATYIWYLDQDSFIMNPEITIEGNIMGAANLEAAMIKDYPVVPPDSIIKTFNHLRGDDVDLVLTHDNDGISAGSFILRNGDWARFFLGFWLDPHFRTYNFQKAETHALEHIVQWHPTILAKLALVPQRLFNAYSKSDHGQVYAKGDLAIRFVGCNLPNSKGCESESSSYATMWREAFKN